MRRPSGPAGTLRQMLLAGVLGFVACPTPAQATPLVFQNVNSGGITGTGTNHGWHVGFVKNGISRDQTEAVSEVGTVLLLGLGLSGLGLSRMFSRHG